jgi:hypothetical protein
MILKLTVAIASLAIVLSIPAARKLLNELAYPKESFNVHPESDKLISKCRVLGNVDPQLTCEKVVLHAPTSTVYMACDSYESRKLYFPPSHGKRIDTSAAGSGGIYTLDLKVNINPY